MPCFSYLYNHSIVPIQLPSSFVFVVKLTGLSYFLFFSSTGVSQSSRKMLSSTMMNRTSTISSSRMMVTPRAQIAQCASVSGFRSNVSSTKKLAKVRGERRCFIMLEVRVFVCALHLRMFVWRFMIFSSIQHTQLKE